MAGLRTINPHLKFKKLLVLVTFLNLVMNLSGRG